MTVTVHAIYPARDGARFDHDYYSERHMKLVREVLGPKGLIDITASKGLAGGPEAPPPYFAVAEMTFPDEATMQAALGAAEPLMADIPNFTDVEPELLIGARM